MGDSLIPMTARQLLAALDQFKIENSTAVASSGCFALRRWPVPASLLRLG
jgi:hypothetical protein